MAGPRQVHSSLLICGTVLAALIASPAALAAATYVVRPGDSLFLIAQRNGVSVQQLQSTNRLWTDQIYAGEVLRLPGAAGSGSSTGVYTSSYTVQPGDSLFTIAQRYGTTVDAIRRVNGLNGNYLSYGDVIQVPSAPSSGSAPAPASGGAGTVTVRSGDSLYLIAQRYGTTVNALRQANGLTGDAIYNGQTLQLPWGTTSSASNGVVVDPGPAGSQSQGLVSGSRYALTQSDYELLARLVSAESQGEPYSGQVAVAATVLHRLGDGRFPSNIHDIIYQVFNTYYYQYSPVENGTINNPAVSSAYQAVQDAINGLDPSKGANGFYNPTGTENSWVTQQPVTVSIGNHVFFQS